MSLSGPARKSNVRGFELGGNREPFRRSGCLRVRTGVEVDLVEAITLRPYRLDDVEAVFAAVMESQAELARWMPWCHANYARADAVAWVERQPEMFQAGTEYNFLIVDETDRVIGSCGLNRLDFVNGTANLGYWVRTSAAGRGVATAAARKLQHWAFESTGLHRLEILAAVENRGSQRVAEKAGAVREAVLRSRLVGRGRRHDAVLYALLRDQSLPEHEHAQAEHES